MTDVSPVKEGKFDITFLSIKQLKFNRRIFILFKSSIRSLSISLATSNRR